MKTLTADLGAIFIGLAEAGVVELRITTRTTMRLTKTLGFAGALVISALVGGTLIGSALATDESTSADATGPAGEYCDVFMDALSTELDVTRDALVSAGQSAAVAAIDAAVEAGDLSEERATTMRERIEQADGSGCAWFGHGFARGFGHGLERGLARGFLGGDVFEAAADALGMESSELIPQLRDAESLEAIADEEDVSYDEVKASVLAAVQADLDAAVAEGLDQERADATIERLTAWLDDGGELRGFGHRFGPGHGGWHDRGADGEEGA
ncbi:MAG: hypothetical protein ACRDG7_17890 [Candidatus Limnocylindria bacterium]